MHKNDREKKEYKKPRLRTIELAAEEVLGTGCKSPSDAPLTPAAPPNCLAGAPCSGIGS